MSQRLIGWLLPGITLAVYAMLLGLGLFRLMPEAHGALPFDLRLFGYSMNEARGYLTLLSPRGYALAQGPIFWLDTVFPVLMGLTLAWWMRPFAGVFGMVCTLAAMSYVALDWAENAAVQAMLTTGPDYLRYADVARAETMTQAKFAALALALALAARQTLRRRRAG